MELTERFDKDFREYLNSAIAYAEVQEEYRPLDVEDEITWLKNWITQNTYAK